MGLLAKDDQGRYYQPNRQSDSVQRNLTAEEQLQEALQRQQKPEADDSGTDKVPDLAPELHEMATNFVQSTDNLTVTSATREIIDTGGLSDQTVTSIATQMGLEPDEVRNRATALNNALLSQARDLTAAHIGTPEAADDVFAWAREHAPSLLRDAIQDHVNNEQSGGYARLARAYLEVLPERNPEMILNSPDAKARDIKRDHNGVITVAIEGAGRVEWRVAVRQGLIAPRWRMD